MQIGVTMTSIGIGALGEPALADLLKGALGDTLSHGVAVAMSAIVAFLIIASAQLIAGEMVPKFYAIDRAEAVARRVARPLQAFSVLFRPFIVAPDRDLRPDPAAARRRHERRSAAAARRTSSSA